jgi:predicted glycoside hydrolase/deacetylase ChbG (UPF0249 family)
MPTLIVTADDFGRTPSVNEGIVRAHEHGIVTSASLMVRWPAARWAAEYARSNPRLSTGLHLDFEESVKRDHMWFTVYRLVAPTDLEHARREAHAQLEAFRRLVGRDPTHLDSHQHIHMKMPVLEPAFRELAAELDVPLRYHGRRFIGSFFGQTSEGEPLLRNVSAEHLVEVIADLEPGVTELGCHPGAGRDSWSTYDRERAVEVEALCDPSVPRALAEHGVALKSFADIKSAPAQHVH